MIQSKELPYPKEATPYDSNPLGRRYRSNQQTAGPSNGTKKTFQTGELKLPQAPKSVKRATLNSSLLFFTGILVPVTMLLGYLYVANENRSLKTHVQVHEKALVEMKAKEAQLQSRIQATEDAFQTLLRGDLLPLFDYAQKAAGGQIDYEVTSQSYTIRPPVLKALTGRWLRSSTNEAIPRHKPGIIIQPQTELTKCWSFTGAQGQVGLKFKRSIHLQSISIDYPILSVSCSAIDPLGLTRISLYISRHLMTG